MLLAAVLAAGRAAAQQAGTATGPPAAGWRLDLRPPRIVVTPVPAAAPNLGAIPRPAEDCAPAWPCRLRLFGILEKNGGVGLKGPALSW